MTKTREVSAEADPLPQLGPRITIGSVTSRAVWLSTPIRRVRGLLSRHPWYGASLAAILYGLLLSSSYSFLFSQTPFTVFVLGGTFPFPARLFIEHAYFSSWNIYYYLGIRGVGIPNYLEIYALTAVFGQGIGERIWIAGTFVVGSLSTFLLCRHFNPRRPAVAVILAFAYSFGPISAAMIYNGDVMTYTMYAFEPLLLFLALKAHGSNSVGSFGYIGVLLIAFLYVFYWDAQEIMWAGVFYILYVLLICVFTSRTARRSILFDASKLAIFVGGFAVLSQSVGAISGFLTGNGASEFSPYSFGTISLSQLVTDLVGNFRAYVPFLYWYVAMILLTLLLLVTPSALKRDKELRLSLFYIALLIQTAFVLLVWACFYWSVQPFTDLLAAYLPVVGAYFPVAGYGLVFSSVFLAAAFGIQRYAPDSGPVAVATSPSLRVARRLFAGEGWRVGFTIGIALALFFVSIPINVGYAPEPSSFDMFSRSQQFLERNALPPSMTEVSNWMYQNTNTTSGYRVYVVPYGTSTVGTLLSEMRWTFDVNLTSFAGPATSQVTNLHNATGLAVDLALEGVEYVIVYGGPYNGFDSTGYLSGQVQFYQSGWPWQISLVPEGSAQNWSSLLNSSSSFLNVAQLGMSTIFLNRDYLGLVYSYQAPSNDSSANRVTPILPSRFNVATTDILFATATHPALGSWAGSPTSGGQPVWNITGNGTASKLWVGPLPPSIGSTFVKTSVTLKERTYYLLTYEISGKDMNASYVFVDFFGGGNGTGNVIEEFGSNVDPGVTWYGDAPQPVRVEALFETPSQFNSSLVVPYVVRNNAANNESWTQFSNISLTEVLDSPAKPLTYRFDSPTEITIDSRASHGLGLVSLLVYCASYDPGWLFRGTSPSDLASSPLFNGQVTVNSYLMSTSNGTFSLIFGPQTDYSRLILFIWTAWIVLIAATSAAFLLPRLLARYSTRYANAR